MTWPRVQELLTATRRQEEAWKGSLSLQEESTLISAFRALDCGHCYGSHEVAQGA